LSRGETVMVDGGGVQFVPSRVGGLPDVTQVMVYPDRLELVSESQQMSFRLTDIAVWPRPAFLWRRLYRFGWRPRWLPVGERNWFRPPSKRYFRFYTEPRIVVYLPDEPAETDYASTLFRRVQDVLLEGGFSTWDLG
jgi:hypothetical protein